MKWLQDYNNYTPNVLLYVRIFIQVYALSVSHLFISPIHLSFLFPVPFIFRETGNPFKFWRVVPQAYSPLLSRMLRRCCCEEVIKVQVILPFSLLRQVQHYPFSQLDA